MELILLDDITVNFGRARALDGISLSLPVNGVLALVGPNGAGKSTLLDVLAGFIHPSNGSVRLVQLRSGFSKKELIQRFVRLHQRLVLPPSLPVWKYLSLAMNPELATSLNGMVNRSWCEIETMGETTPNWLKYLLKSAGAWESLGTKIGKLSHGQQRVVALAAALLSPKPGILLDEPMTGLSTASREAAMDVITMHGKNRLIVIAEHDIDTVKKIADELVVVVGGRVVQQYSGNSVAKAELLGHFLIGQTK